MSRLKDEDGLPKDEILRRLRLGDLRKYLRSRYGHTLPDDDPGRDDLYELLLPISLGPEAATLKMANAVKLWARWMSGDEAEQLIDRIIRTPIYLRKPTGRELGLRLRVTNQERELWKLWTIAPYDMTDKQMQEHRKAKERARKQRRRQRQPRAAYLASSLSRTKPWEIKGESRSTWERKRRKARDASVSAIRLSAAPDTLASPEKPNRRKRLSEPRRLH
jgi:hypothetical protein